MQGPETRKSLLLTLRDPQKDEAWSEFMAIYEPLVYQLARGKGFQHADAQDLTQEVFAAVGSAIERFDPERAEGSFRGWLFRIARNLMINFLTRQKEPAGSSDSRLMELLEQQADPTSEEATRFDLEYRREVFAWAARQAKPHFSEETWQAFWLTGVEGKSIDEVAAMLGKTAGAVRVARCRVLAKLKEYALRFEESQ